MYNSLTGTITEKGASHICLFLQGIEWKLESSLTTIETTGKIGSEQKIYTYLQHKEDGMTLFGFASNEERSLFLDLIKVNGVGPKAAQKILSGIRVNEFITCLENEDLNTLTRVPGLGKKTAQKIILALKGKLTLETPELPGSPASVNEELLESLVAMGFDKKKVKTVLGDVMKNNSDAEEGEILRLCIVQLSV